MINALIIALTVLATTVKVPLSTFPQITAEKLSGELVNIPKSFEGKYALIGVGMSKKAEDELRTWQAPVYNKFVAKTGLMDEFYDIEVCFLPVFTGLSKAAKNKIVKKLKDQNESLVYDHLYIYSGSKEPIQTLGAKKKDIPYFYLIDESGNIVWSAEGRFRQSYLDSIEEILIQ